MIENIEDICKTLLEVSAAYKINELKILEKTKSIIKARLYVFEDIYVQIYVNIKKPKKSFTLVLNDKRIFGKDYIFGQWHLHPFENQEYYDESEKGRESVAVKEFVEEALSIIYEKIKLL